jgi:hypothetical protein
MYNKVMDDNSKQDPKSIKISDINNASFSDNTEPKDDRLMELLKLAYTKQIYCRTVIVDIENVIPFSDYKPNLSDNYVKYFNDKFQVGRPPALIVYQRDNGKFVMSDDYSAYYMYKMLNADKAVCQVLDAEFLPENIIEASDPYYIGLPSVEQIN